MGQDRVPVLKELTVEMGLNALNNNLGSAADRISCGLIKDEVTASWGSGTASEALRLEPDLKVS